MTMFVTIRLTEVVNKFIGQSNIRRTVNRITHRLAVITYQKQNCNVVVLDTHTHISIDSSQWNARYQLQGTNKIGVPFQQNRHLQFPRRTCHVSVYRVSVYHVSVYHVSVYHVSVYHVTCLSTAVFICREVFSWFAGLSFDLVKNQIEIRLLAQAPTDVSSNSLASHVAIVINISTVCEHKHKPRAHI